MTDAQLSIRLPEGTWIGDVSRDHPEVSVSVLAAVPGSRSGFALVRIGGDSVGAFLEDMRDHDGIVTMSVVNRREHEVVAHFETTHPLLLFSSRAAGMPIRLPVEIRDGTAVAEFTGSEGLLSDLGEKLRAFGLEFDVEYVRTSSELTELLTDRQQEVVRRAVDLGYYETPRRCSLTEIAAELDIAKSTCSEILHRAEGTIVTVALREASGFDAPPGTILGTDERTDTPVV